MDPILAEQNIESLIKLLNYILVNHDLEISNDEIRDMKLAYQIFNGSNELLLISLMDSIEYSSLTFLHEIKITELNNLLNKLLLLFEGSTNINQNTYQRVYQFIQFINTMRSKYPSDSIPQPSCVIPNGLLYPNDSQLLFPKSDGNIPGFTPIQMEASGEHLKRTKYYDDDDDEKCGKHCCLQCSCIIFIIISALTAAVALFIFGAWLYYHHHGD